MLQFATQAMTKKEIWKTSFQLCLANFVRLYLFLFVIQMLFQATHLAKHHVYYTNSVVLSPTVQTMPSGKMVSYEIVLVLIFVFVFSLVFHQMGSMLKGAQVKLMDSILWVLKHYIYLLGLVCLMFILSILGFICFVWPGLFLAVALYSFYPYVIVEEKRWIPAFKMALKITWGKWWRAFITVMLPVLGFLIANILIVLLITFFLSIFGVPKSVILSIAVVIEVFITAFMTLWILAIQLVLWNDLKIRYEENKVKL